MGVGVVVILLGQLAFAQMRVEGGDGDEVEGTLGEGSEGKLDMAAEDEGGLGLSVRS